MWFVRSYHSIQPLGLKACGMTGRSLKIVHAQAGHAMMGQHGPGFDAGLQLQVEECANVSMLVASLHSLIKQRTNHRSEAESGRQAQEASKTIVSAGPDCL